MTHIQNFFSYILNNWRIVFDPVFQKGLIVGAALIVLIIIILKLILFLCKRKNIRCNGVTGKNESGEVFVSSIAISDLIKSLEPEFIGVNISKSILFKQGKNYYIKLIAELNDKDVDFPNLVDNIRGKIILAIKNNLGIECVNKIDIHLKRVKG
jgi:hypothetical protein